MDYLLTIKKFTVGRGVPAAFDGVAILPNLFRN